MMTDRCHLLPSSRWAFDFLVILVRQDAAAGRLVLVGEVRLVVRAGRRNFLVRFRLFVDVAILCLLCHAKENSSVRRVFL